MLGPKSLSKSKFIDMDKDAGMVVRISCICQTIGRKWWRPKHCEIAATHLSHLMSVSCPGLQFNIKITSMTQGNTVFSCIFHESNTVTPQKLKTAPVPNGAWLMRTTRYNAWKLWGIRSPEGRQHVLHNQCIQYQYFLYSTLLKWQGNCFWSGFHQNQNDKIKPK